MQSWFQRGRADGQVLGRDRCRERKSQVLGRAGSSPWVEIDRLGHMILPIRWLVTHGLAVFVLP